MDYLGDFATSSTIRYYWNTNGANGASITRATDGTLRVYKNTSSTERSSSSGITQNEDFDSLTGVHTISIDTSDNADAGFYAAGNDYTLVYAAMTIDGQTVNAALAQFSIENRNIKANVTQVNGTSQTARDIGAALPAAASGTSGGLPTLNSDLTVSARDEYAEKWWYHTAKTGNDSNPGTRTSPRLTIAATITAARSGDGIFVLTGTYAEQVSFGSKALTMHGANRSTTILTTASAGDTLTLFHNSAVRHMTVRTTGTAVADGAIYAANRKGLTLEDCIVSGWVDGVNFATGCENIVIRGCDITGAWDAIAIPSSVCATIEGNYLESLNSYTNSDAQMNAIYASNSRGVVVRNNIIKSTRSQATAANYRTVAVYAGMDMWLENNAIYTEVFEDAGTPNSDSVCIFSDYAGAVGTSGITMRNNTLYTVNSAVGGARQIDLGTNILNDAGGNNIDTSLVTVTGGTVVRMATSSSGWTPTLASTLTENVDAKLSDLESGGGASAASIWSYGQRSLTLSQVVVQPAQQYAEREIVKGNSYGSGGRSFLVTIQDGAEWPTDPSAWTWVLTADKHPDNLASGSASFTGSGTGSGTGTSRAVDVTLPASTTEGASTGLYSHSLRGSNGDDVWTIELGLLNVRDDPAV